MSIIEVIKEILKWLALFAFLVAFLLFGDGNFSWSFRCILGLTFIISLLWLVEQLEKHIGGS